MAESNEKNNLHSSEAQDALKSGKLSYEELPKEELVKLAKKHLALLQKVKNKCDALSKECAQHKEQLISAKDATNREKETHGKLNDLYRKYFPPDSVQTDNVSPVSFVEEIDKELHKMKERESKILSVEEELNKAQKEKEKISVSFREAEEQVQCMKLKLDTLTMTCQYLQEDLSKNQELNKELIDEVNILTAARDTALQSIASIKARVNENNSLEIENLKLECERLMESEGNLKNELMDSHKLNSDLQQELNSLIKAKTELQNENVNLAEKCKLLTEENDMWKLQLEEYENEKVHFSSCTEKLCMLEQENEAYKTQNSELERHIDELKEENLKLSEELYNEKSSLNEFNCQIEILISSIKQGVKQKNASNKFKTANEPMQNISILRALCDETISQLKNHVMRTNYLETELKDVMQQKQKAEEELFQLVDLKQFLEDEAKGLLEENGHLKSILNSSVTHSENDAEIISRLEKELQESMQREQELLGELNNFTVYAQEQVCPLVECEINKISSKNIPETIMEELQEDETTLSGPTQIDFTIMKNSEIREMNEVKLNHTCDVSSQINNLNSNVRDISVQTVEFLVDASTEVARILCDSCTETNIYCSELSVQTMNLSSNASVETDVLMNNSSNESLKISRDTSCEIAETIPCDDAQEMVCSSALKAVNKISCDSSSQTNDASGVASTFVDQLFTVSTENDKNVCDASTEVGCNDFSTKAVQYAAVSPASDVFSSSGLSFCSPAVTEENVREIANPTEMEPAENDFVPRGVIVEELNKTKDLVAELTRCNYALEQDVSAAHGENCLIAKDLENKLKIIKDLKETIESKSKLVESIHCQMDSLLTKVEELNEEIKAKDSDLDAAGNKIQNLESLLKCLNSAEKRKQNSLLAVSEIVAVLKKSKDDISVEVSELQKDCRNMFHNANNVVSGLHSQLNNFYCGIKSLKQETAVALEDEVSNLKETLIEIEQELRSIHEVLKNSCSLKGIVVESHLVEEKCNVGGQHTSDETTDLSNEQICKQHLNNKASGVLKHSTTLCSAETEKQKVLYQIKLLHKELQKVLDLINQLTVNNDKAVKELKNYKLQIIPNLERTISDLQLKLQEQSIGSHEGDGKLDPSKLSINRTECMQNTSEETLNLLQKQVTEAETKMNKFKLVAIKVKKELAETKKLYQEALSEKDKHEKLMSDMSHELGKLSTVNHQHVRNFQSLQSEYDKLQDECEELKAILRTLEGDLAASVAELNDSKQKYSDLDAECEKSKSVLQAVTLEKQTEEKKCTELESKVIILEAKCEEKQKMIDDLESELSKSKTKITEVDEDRELIKQKLEEARKEGKKHSLLDLEMADYERTISELNVHLEKKCEEISELQSDVEGLNIRINCLQEEISHCESQRITEEKRADNLKEILEKTKEELIIVKNHEHELSNAVADLQSQVETIAQQGEEYKVQLAKVSAEAEHLKGSLNSSAESHQKIVRSLDAKINSLQDEVILAHKETESGKQEFENYKVRVHSVLKQQKHGSYSFTSNDAEIKEELQKLNEKLKLQVTDLSEKLRACTLENESLREDHDHLLLRYSKIVEELETKNRSWSLKLEQVNSDKKRLEAAQEELISQHALQHSMLTTSFKQIKDLQEQHKHELKEMQKQLEAADIEIAYLQREQRNTSGVPSTPSAHDDPFPFDICSQERQEGEGSECTEGRSTPIKPMSLATIPTSGFLPLEKLLQSPVEPDTPRSFISNQDSEKLSSDLNSSYKKIDHLSELLNESEANNLRLNEQVRVLKEEVRRLERNKEREQHAENLEYLKNIFVKFITLQSGDEKTRLIPVLTTMLKLSPLEQQQLRSVAGESSETDASSGWGAYLHSWSGLM